MYRSDFAAIGWCSRPQPASPGAQGAQVEAAEQSCRRDASSPLELLDAQRQLAATRQSQVTLHQTEQASRMVLLCALGGRWTVGG
ncbi:MAG: hypothetical protein ACK520_13690 [Inhella sp.]|uniref:hypothetical protein n=1 Tax=Inhella sp. TaxID=1921806 RepID=UPI0022CC123D|nr:hypothetical protein [Inhella sp.]MCZ8235323.1 hypothetical protein [Inhella sp.]